MPNITFPESKKPHREKSGLTPEHLKNLMDWFEVHHREMPWRGQADPYKIWISEVMLQQTQVVTVTDYYNRWMARFPTIQSLAEADLTDVLKLWEGLGYYARARNLHRGAQVIRDRHNGIIPDSESSLLKVPGIGTYIAGAILSIAFNSPVAAIDGNVLRVMTRLFALADNISRPGTRLRIRTLLEKAFFQFEPRWVNQAWMELGALVCKKTPICSDCPMAARCRAHGMDRVREFPVKPSKKKIPVRTGTGFVIVEDDHCLLVQRPETGLLGGLWELPNLMHDECKPDKFCREHGIEIQNTLETVVTHTYSHFKVIYTLCTAHLSNPWRQDSRWTDHRWVAITELGSLPRPGVMIKALKIAGLIS